jgi:hypothetical protein
VGGRRSNLKERQEARRREKEGERTDIVEITFFEKHDRVKTFFFDFPILTFKVGHTNKGTPRYVQRPWIVVGIG